MKLACKTVMGAATIAVVAGAFCPQAQAAGVAPAGAAFGSERASAAVSIAEPAVVVVRRRAVVRRPVVRRRVIVR